jgi:hypothetical protein
MNTSHIIVAIVVLHTIIQHALNSAWRKAYKTKGYGDDYLVITAFVLESMVVIALIISIL